jgi:hypothetical protein
MSTVTSIASLSRILSEGYGPGAWHGADLKAALADVAPAQAFRRPAPGRHNIAEIALHHAWCVRNVRAQLSGEPQEPIVLEGDDWFEVPDKATLGWSKVLDTVDVQQQRLADLVSRIEAGTTTSPLPEEERLGVVLGITSHAIYHAGQVQLIKRLSGS